MTILEFETAVARMRDGDTIVYATGFIPYALYEAEKRGENIGQLTKLQTATYPLYQQNELHLTQKKLAENQYEYRATKRTP
jgi:hypothetical protein